MKAAPAAVLWLVLGAGPRVPSKAAARAPGARSPSVAAAGEARADSRAAAHPEPRGARMLPMLPRVARVEVEVASDHVVVVERVDLPRGDWRSGGLEAYVAFGSPGMPVAIDARLAPAPSDDETGEAPEDGGEPLEVERAVRPSAGTSLLLGRSHMAGVVVRLKERDLRRVFASSERASLRVRTLLPAPAADPGGARDVVVRLGTAGELPMTLERVQIASARGAPPIRGAEATLCGADADARPLAITVAVPGRSARPANPEDARAAAPIDPAMAVRHASDDLCVRWWMGS